MTVREKQLLKAYFVNQSLKIDSELELAKSAFFREPTDYNAYRVSMLISKKKTFDHTYKSLFLLLHLDD